MLYWLTVIVADSLAYDLPLFSSTPVPSLVPMGLGTKAGVAVSGGRFVLRCRAPVSWKR